ncbi:hypothetical protein HK099_003287 [Clydaea vesicula]|uniref:Uncharacterized protein n=1 Tax=Clydaea vesicula TaxID=447962 RepID=A0AAD5U1T4_9FUNG|nr:hypothetical protein HK099_003287 [Clydaea vesicula]
MSNSIKRKGSHYDVKTISHYNTWFEMGSTQISIKALNNDIKELLLNFTKKETDSFREFNNTCEEFKFNLIHVICKDIPRRNSFYDLIFSLTFALFFQYSDKHFKLSVLYLSYYLFFTQPANFEKQYIRILPSTLTSLVRVTKSFKEEGKYDPAFVFNCLKSNDCFIIVAVDYFGKTETGFENFSKTLDQIKNNLFFRQDIILNKLQELKKILKTYNQEKIENLNNVILKNQHKNDLNDTLILECINKIQKKNNNFDDLVNLEEVSILDVIDSKKCEEKLNIFWDNFNSNANFLKNFLESGNVDELPPVSTKDPLEINKEGSDQDKEEDLMMQLNIENETLFGEDGNLLFGDLNETRYSSF